MPALPPRRAATTVTGHRPRCRYCRKPEGPDCAFHDGEDTPRGLAWLARRLGVAPLALLYPDGTDPWG